MFLVAYYGLFRVGELTESQHAIKLRNVHVAQNRKRILFILPTSKTHGLEDRPQKIRLDTRQKRKRKERQTQFCPVNMTEKYLQIRGQNSNKTINDNDQFFVFSDGSNVKAHHMRSILRKTLTKLNLDATLYDTHSFRIGRASDLLKYNYKVTEIKQKGRWRSNIVYRYLRN